MPLRLAPFDAPLQIAHAQYIDFKRGWALGLADLLALLAEAKISRMVPNENADLWQSVQLRGAKPIADTPERLISNWLQIDAVPSRMLFYDFKAGISLGAAQRAIKESLLPVVAFNRGFLSFAPIHQLQEYFGPNLPTELVAERPTDSFLEQGWPDLHIGLREARAKFSDLSRQGFDALFRAKGLCSFEIASGRLAWWPTSARASLKKLSFGWPDGPAGLRQIVGHSRKRGFHWHYGVSCWVRAYPTRHVRVAGRVVFTADGHTPLGDAKRLHRLRRSFCKSWRNDRWRDLLLAFLYWLAEGGSSIEAPMGEGAAIRPLLPPIIVDAPFGIDSPDDKSETTDEESDDSNGPGDGQGEEGADEYAEEMDDNT